jgi:lysophospholipase L1-like esterase
MPKRLAIFLERLAPRAWGWMLGFASAAVLLAPHALAGPPIALGPPRHWRIEPLGDSITQGNPAHWTYRYPLWKMLIDAGVDFDFVGSINYFDITNPAIPPYRGRPFDFDHEGHVFYQSNQIAGQLPTWLSEGAGGSGYTPDIALMHVGTNDALLAQPTAATVANLSSIVATLRQRNPRVHVLLARIIPIFNPLDTGGQQNGYVSALNAQLDGLAAALDQPASRVLVVDHHTGFMANHTLPAPLGGDTYDGVHPSDVGQEKMARRWLEALQLFLLAPTVARDAHGRMAVDFLRVKNRERLTYRVGVSSEPGVWDWSPAATETVGTTDTGDWTELVRIRDLIGDGTRYLKFTVDYGP